MSNLAAHHPGNLFCPAGLFGALQRLEGVVGPARPVAAGSHDGSGHGYEARARYDALIDGSFELHVEVAGALGAEISLRGNAGAEGRLCACHRAGHAQSHRLLEHLVIPESFIVGMEEQVGVPFDQAR